LFTPNLTLILMMMMMTTAMITIMI